MATTAQTFYFTATADDVTLSGGNKHYAVSATDPGTANTTTTLTWTSTTASTETVIPLTATSTASDTSSNNGWLFNLTTGTDAINSTSTAERVIPAGMWTVFFAASVNAPALLGTISFTPTWNFYRVAANGGARTLLFSYQMTATSATSANTYSKTANTAAQPQITLAPGEDIMVGITVNSAATSSLGATTNTVLTVPIGGANGLYFSVPAPGVRTLYPWADTASSASSSSLQKSTGKILSATETSMPVLARRITAFRSFTVTETSAPVMARALTAARSFAASTTSTASVVRQIGKALTTNSVSVAAEVQKLMFHPFTYAVTSTPTVMKALTKTPLSASTTASATLVRAVTAARTFSASTTSTAHMLVQIADTVLNRLAGGATTVVKKVVTYVFDD